MAVLTNTFNADGSLVAGASPEREFAFRVKQLNAANDEAEVVTWSLTGSFNGATATWQVCVDETVSPRVWAPVSNGAFTAAAADNLVLATGTLARLVISGSGSPIPNITVTARGPITIA